MGLTMVACLAISAYALLTKTDFTMMGAGLCMALMVVFVVSLIALFLPAGMARPLEIGIAGFVIIIMGFFIIYDLQLIVGGGRHQYDIDDYIIAAMNLYVDVMTMFLEILKLLNLLNSGNDN